MFSFSSSRVAHVTRVTLLSLYFIIFIFIRLATAQKALARQEICYVSSYTEKQKPIGDKILYGCSFSTPEKSVVFPDYYAAGNPLSTLQ
jgi:hypothetical protein